MQNEDKKGACMTPKGEVQALLVAGRLDNDLIPAFYSWRNSLFGFGFLC